MVPAYDPLQVSHIVTDASEKITLKSLGLKSLDEIPSHIPTLKWEWVSSANGKGLEFMYAAFGSRMDADSSMAPRASEDVVIGASPHQADPPSNAPSYADTYCPCTHPHPDLYSSSRDYPHDNLSSIGNLGPPERDSSVGARSRPFCISEESQDKEDPLAGFYAQAREEYNSQVLYRTMA